MCEPVACQWKRMWEKKKTK